MDHHLSAMGEKQNAAVNRAAAVKVPHRERNMEERNICRESVPLHRLPGDGSTPHGYKKKDVVRAALVKFEIQNGCRRGSGW